MRLPLAALLFDALLVISLFPIESRASLLNVDLCSWSNLIVIGSAVDRLSYFDEKGMIRTKVVFSVDTVISGTPSSKLSLRIKGGNINGIRERNHDYPGLRLHDRYLLFLRTNEQYEYPKFIRYYYIDPQTPLPSEQALRNLWTDLCAAYPDGLPPGSLTVNAFEAMAHGRAPDTPSVQQADEVVPAIRDLFNLGGANEPPDQEAPDVPEK